MLNNFKIRGIKKAKDTLDRDLKIAQKHHFKVKKNQSNYTKKVSLLKKFIKSIIN